MTGIKVGSGECAHIVCGVNLFLMTEMIKKMSVKCLETQSNYVLGTVFVVYRIFLISFGLMVNLRPISDQ